MMLIQIHLEKCFLEMKLHFQVDTLKRVLTDLPKPPEKWDIQLGWIG